MFDLDIGGKQLRDGDRPQGKWAQCQAATRALLLLE